MPSGRGHSAVRMTITSQQRQMIGTVRDLAQAEFRNDALKYMDGTFPWENMRKLAKLGVLGMAVPEEYGGLGLPVFDTALVLEEIAKVCYVTAMAVLGEAGVQTRVIATYAPDDIKRRILPKVCTGECILAICMTEPHAGTDVANYKTNTRGDERPRHPQRHQDADQPRRRGRHVRRVHPDRRQAGPRGHRLRAGRARHVRASPSPAPITRWAARTCTRCSSTTASCRWRTW